MRCWWLLLAALGAAPACSLAPLLHLEAERAATSGGRHRVAILEAETNPVFARPIQGFLSRFEGTVRIYSGAGPAQRQEALRALEAFAPDLVFCLGNAAAALAAAELRHLPVLYALAPDAAKLQLEGAPMAMGIGMEPPTLLQFTQFRMVQPELHRVLTFHGPRTPAPQVQRAAALLAEMDIELVAVPVVDLQGVQEAVRARLGEVDALWMTGDAVVMNQAAFAYLRQAAWDARKPLLTSLTDKFAEAGALMSASLELTSLGSQAALMARKVLDQGISPADLGLQPPIGALLALNLETAERIGAVIDPRILPYVDRIFVHTRLR